MRTVTLTVFPRSKELLRRNEQLHDMANNLASDNKRLSDELEAEKARNSRLVAKLNDALFQAKVAKGEYRPDKPYILGEGEVTNAVSREDVQ